MSEPDIPIEIQDLVNAGKDEEAIMTYLSAYLEPETIDKLYIFKSFPKDQQGVPSSFPPAGSILLKIGKEKYSINVTHEFHDVLTECLLYQHMMEYPVPSRDLKLTVLECYAFKMFNRPHRRYGHYIDTYYVSKDLRRMYAHGDRNEYMTILEWGDEWVIINGYLESDRKFGLKFNSADIPEMTEEDKAKILFEDDIREIYERRRYSWLTDKVMASLFETDDSLLWYAFVKRNKPLLMEIIKRYPEKVIEAIKTDDRSDLLVENIAWAKLKMLDEAYLSRNDEETFAHVADAAAVYNFDLAAKIMTRIKDDTTHGYTDLLEILRERVTLESAEILKDLVKIRLPLDQEVKIQEGSFRYGHTKIYTFMDYILYPGLQAGNLDFVNALSEIDPERTERWLTNLDWDQILTQTYDDEEQRAKMRSTIKKILSLKLIKPTRAMIEKAVEKRKKTDIYNAQSLNILIDELIKDGRATQGIAKKTINEWKTLL